MCTRKDPEGRPTVYERLPRMSGARCCCRSFDVNTSGLLLFTTDGEPNRLMHPSQEVEREYAVRIFGEVTDAMINRLKKGVQLEDGLAHFDTIKAVGGGEGMNRWYHVTLKEGRNREVRRLWESQEVQVSRLIRVRYGDINLESGLPQGGWSELELDQVNELRAKVGLQPEDKSFVDPRHQESKQRKFAKIRKATSKRRTAYAKHNV